MKNPESVDGLDLLRAMREGVDYKFTIKMRALRLQVRPLSNHEFTTVLAEVKKLIEDAEPEHQTRVHEEVELAKRILILATTSDIGVKDEKLTHYLLDRMTTGEISALYKEYKQFEETINADADTMQSSEGKALVEELKKNDTAWRGLSRLECKHVVHYLMTKQDLPEDNVSTG